jgi:methylmalonyl-CoA mutase N-terminal domain/subunit
MFTSPEGAPRCAAYLGRRTGDAGVGESAATLDKLRQTVIEDDNVFAVLVDAVRCCSLGQITSAFYEVGGQYRRSM